MLVIVSGFAGTDDLRAQHFDLKTSDAGFGSAWDGTGVAVADYDMDGDLDVYFVSYKPYDQFDPRSWNRLYRNNGDKTFSEVGLEAGVRGEGLSNSPLRVFGNKFGASWVDYDSDGDPDLFLTSIGLEALFRNNGDGTFEDVIEQSGLQIQDADADLTENSGSLWWDYDLDGDLDVYVTSWSGKNRHYMNNGDGTFEDLSVVSGLDVDVRTWMGLTNDIDRDGRLDLYLVNDFGPNLLFLQQEDGSWEESSEIFEIGNKKESMGATIGDANNDGFFDIFVTNNSIHTSHLNSLYLAAPSPPFAEEGVVLGIGTSAWGWGTEFFDADHDGDLDLYAVNGSFLEDGTPNRFFTNRLIEDGVFSFEDRSESSGTNGTAESHGLVVFDYDNDGDLDMLVSTWRSPLYFYENVSFVGNWLKVNLIGVSSNLNGVGARVRASTEQAVYHRLNDGIDFLGQSIQPIHFGLGDAITVDELLIEWPSGSREIFLDVAVNQTFEVIEGSGIAVSIQESLPIRNILSSTAFPNPFSNTFHLKMESGSSGPFELEVFSILGRRLLSQDITLIAGQESKLDIDLSTVAAGVYMYSLRGADGGRVESGTIVKTR